jgi:hypothetical protein
MAADTNDVKYSEIVVRAEKAVVGVQDPDLKRIAFQKILETLLAEGAPESRLKEVSSREVKGSSHRAASVKGTSKAKGGPKAYVEELIADQFFKTPRSIAAVRSELANNGHRIAVTSLSGPLQTLCQQKKLRRKKDGEAGGFSYSNW